MMSKCYIETLVPEAMYDLQQAWTKEDKTEICDLLISLATFCFNNYPEYHDECWDELHLLSDVLLRHEYLDSDDPDRRRVGELFVEYRDELIMDLVEDSHDSINRPPPTTTLQ